MTKVKDQTDTGYVNPVMVAQAAVSAMAEQEALKKGLDAAVLEAGKCSDILSKCMEEAQCADGTMDWEKITHFGGATSQEKQDKIVEINSRLNGLSKAIKDMRREAHEKKEAEKIAERNASQGGPELSPELQELLAQQGFTPNQGPAMSQLVADAVKSDNENWELGSSDFAEAVIVKADGGGGISFQVEPSMPRGRNRSIMATLFETQHWEQNRVYEPGWLPKVNTPISLTPMFHSGPMASKHVSYWEETVHVSAAETRAEGAAAAESRYELEERRLVPISVAHYVPLTEESLEDRYELYDYLDYVMPLGVLQKLDSKLAAGTESEFTGVIKKAGIGRHKYESAANPNVVGAIQKPWNVLIDAKFQGMQHGFGILGMQMPTHCAVHPDFWLQCLKSETSAAGYYVGGPAAGGLFAAPWGMDLIASNHFTMEVSTNGAANHEFAGFVADMSPMFHKLYYRHGIIVRFGMINDDFIKFRLAVRAEVRACFAIKRAGAFIGLVNPKADGNEPTD